MSNDNTFQFDRSIQNTVNKMYDLVVIKSLAKKLNLLTVFNFELNLIIACQRT